VTTEAPQLRRILGLGDLTLLLVVAIVNLNLVPVVAAAGLSALSLWVFAFVLFFLPQAVAVTELASRHPGEGGIYLWSKAAFGDFHGFVCGWCYWNVNIVYLPTLFLYIVGYAAFTGGEATEWLAGDTLFAVSLSLLLLWAITLLNVVGLGAARWVQNAGAIGAVIATVAIVLIAVAALGSQGSATPMTLSNLLPDASDWRTISMLGVVCFAFIGLELGCVMGDEIKEPRKNVPRAVLGAGLACMVLYAVFTFVLQAIIPVEDIGLIEGLPQAIDRVAAGAGLSALMPPLALILSLTVVGSACAWTAGSARVPFVMGIDRYLPAAFGRTHPRFRTPHVALVAHAVASTGFILMNAFESGVRDMYLALLGTAVVINLIPFLYMFAALVVAARAPQAFGGREGFFRSAWPCYTAGIAGFVVSAAGIALQFVPPADVESVWNYELKMVGGLIALIAPGVVLFLVGSRRRVAATAPDALGDVLD
jgi:amino acid transporter